MREEKPDDSDAGKTAEVEGREKHPAGAVAGTAVGAAAGAAIGSVAGPAGAAAGAIGGAVAGGTAGGVSAEGADRSGRPGAARAETSTGLPTSDDDAFAAGRPRDAASRSDDSSGTLSPAAERHGSDRSKPDR